MKSFFSSISIFITAIFILPLVFSCKANISSEDDACFIRVSIDGEDSDSRTVLPKEIDIDKVAFSLAATQGERAKTAFWNSLAEMRSSTFEIDYGTWDFTLTAYSEGIAVLADTKKNVAVAIGANSLSFTLHAPENGTGSFSMKIKVGKEFSAVQATLCDMTGRAITEEEMGSSYNPETDGALTQSWTSEDFAAEDFDGTVTFSISANVPKGYYMLSFAFTKVSGEDTVTSLFKTVAEIAPGNESSDSYDVTEGTEEEPNENIVAFYSVKYEDGVDGEEIDVPVDNKLYKEGESIAVDFKNIGTRLGYDFLGWDENPSVLYPGYTSNGTNRLIVPKGNVTLYAKWQAKGDIPYTVRHWKQKLNEAQTAASGTDTTIVNDGESPTCADYELSEADTESLTGTTAALTSAVAKSYTGFTHQAIDQKNIESNGSTVVDVFYNRTLYTATYNDNVEDSEIAVPIDSSWCYGAKVTVNYENSNGDAMSKSGLRTGYTFLGWSENPLAVTATYTSESSASPVMGTSGIKLYAVWSKNEASITIVLDTESDMVPFTCEITGENKNSVKFTAPEGYESYTWYVSNVSGRPVGTEAEYIWEMVSDGTYYITLLAADEAGKIWSSMMTMTIKVDKQ